MTEPMIERVARAMYADTNGRADKWREEEPLTKDVYRSNARAAIEAMREPTEAMTFKGMYKFAEAYENSNPRGVGQCEIDQVWQAMIEAALSEDSQ